MYNPPRRAARACARTPASPVVAGILCAVLLVSPTGALACACGCGVFDVGAGMLSAMPNSESGLTVWLRYNAMDQNQNWVHGSAAPASYNSDKDLDTEFVFLGGEYQIDPDWTVMAELPFYHRSLTTTDDGTVFGPPGSLYTGHLSSLGDLELVGTYTGFSPDLSSGLGLGVKLPTGDDTGPRGPLGGSEFDRDSLPGTGSTDVILTGYHTGNVPMNPAFQWFVQAKYQFAVATHDSYRPGNELDAAAGLAYDFGPRGAFSDIMPLVQLIDSWRAHDSGANADPPNSGYERVLVAPGFQVQIDKFRIFADVELPIYQYANAASAGGTRGQLMASALWGVQLAYDF
ncbi:MAG TPA: hypothetical protein VHT03_00215 [Rhizomicrobium sp.]|nr:hypothetical protein [Rhizomicrobium sp.]